MIKTILNRRDKRVYDFILADDKHLGMTPNKQYVDMLYSLGKLIFWEKDEQIIGAAGVYKQWLGCGYAWAYLSDDIKCNALRLHRDCKKYLKEFCCDLGFHRIHTFMDPDGEKAIKWVESLGFEKEGHFKEYTSNRTDIAQYWKRI